MPLHMRTMHTSESDKKFQCDKCGKGFIDITRMREHSISVHSSERPFPCRFGCGFSCSTRGNRTKHEKAKHKAESLNVVEKEEKHI